MANLEKIPLQDGFETSLSQEWDGQVGTVNVNTTPDFTFPAGVTTYIVVNPTKANIQIAEVNAYDPVLKTLTVSNITLEKGASVPSTAQLHSVNSKVIISDNYQFWKDIRDTISTKLDNDGGNTTTTWDLQVGGSAFRIRKDGADMKFTDDSNAEISLSTIAAAAGADRKVAATLNDTTPGNLTDKLTVGDGLTTQLLNPAGNEQYEVSVDLSDANTFIDTTTGITDSGIAIKTDSNGKLDNSFLVSGEVIASEDIDLSKIIYIDSDGEAHISRGVDYGTDNVSDTGNKSNANIFYLTNTTFVLVYDNSTADDSYAVAGTISNGQITLGARTTIDSSVDQLDRSTFGARLNDTQFVIAQEADLGSGGDLSVNVCTVTGTSISVGPAQSIEVTAGTHSQVDIVAINDTKFIINWYNLSESEIKAVVCNVSGSTISPGANTTIHGAVTSGGETQVALIGTDKVLFMSGESSSEIRYRTGTITGTVISLGTNSTYTGFVFSQLSLQRVADDICIASWDEGGTPAARYITVSGTTITQQVKSTGVTGRAAGINGNIVVFWAIDHYYLYVIDTVGFTFQSIGDKVISARNNSSGEQICLASGLDSGIAISFDMINGVNPVVYLSDISVNKLVSGESVLATESLEIKGVLAKGFTGLLPGLTYYDSDNGEVSPFNSSGQEIGSAISSTEMILK